MERADLYISAERSLYPAEWPLVREVLVFVWRNGRLHRHIEYKMVRSPVNGETYASRGE